jgi:hypothetical protein
VTSLRLRELVSHLILDIARRWDAQISDPVSETTNHGCFLASKFTVLQIKVFSPKQNKEEEEEEGGGGGKKREEKKNQSINK